MLIFGTRGKTLDLGVEGYEHCPTCGTTQQFRRFLDYRYGHIDWIIRVVTQKQYYKLCDICRRGTALDAKRVEQILGRNPIPLFDRFGLAFAGAAFALTFLAVFVANL